jgi:type I restriction enzyme S subunit
MTFTENLDDIVQRNGDGLLARHDSWGRVRLREVATVLNGYPFESARFNKDEGFPLLRIRDILNDRTEVRVTGSWDPRYKVNPGELVVGMDGDFNCALWQGPAALLNQRVCKITPHESIYLRKFLNWVLPGYLHAINEATSSVTVRHLSSRTIQEIPLPLPPLAEQRRIVESIESYFTRLDAVAATLERVRMNLARYRRSVLRLSFEGDLTGTASGFPLRRLKEVADRIQYGYTASATETLEGPRFLRITDIQNGKVDWGSVPGCRIDDSAENQFALVDGDLVFARTGATTGKSYLIRNPPKAVFASYLIRVRPSREVIPQFLWYFFQSDRYWRQIHTLKQGVGQPNVSGSRLAEVLLPVPPLSGQQRIIAEIERRFSVIDEVTSEVRATLTRFAGIRRSILKNAFEGRIARQDPNDEPASSLLERMKLKRLVVETPNHETARLQPGA